MSITEDVKTNKVKKSRRVSYLDAISPIKIGIQGTDTKEDEKVKEFTIEDSYNDKGLDDLEDLFGYGSESYSEFTIEDVLDTYLLELYDIYLDKGTKVFDLTQKTELFYNTTIKEKVIDYILNIDGNYIRTYEDKKRRINKRYVEGILNTINTYTINIDTDFGINKVLELLNKEVRLPNGYITRLYKVLTVKGDYVETTVKVRALGSKEEEDLLDKALCKDIKLSLEDFYGLYEIFIGLSLEDTNYTNNLSIHQQIIKDEQLRLKSIEHITKNIGKQEDLELEAKNYFGLEQINNKLGNRLEDNTKLLEVYKQDFNNNIGNK